MAPRHSVATQQKINTASGSEIAMLLNMNHSSAGTGMPAVKK